MSAMASRTHRWALLLTALGSVHPVFTQVRSRVWQNSPAEFPPSWPTKSTSQNPGRSSFHSAKVRMGIWRLSMEPGLVPERPLTFNLARSGASIRSMVAEEIARSLDRTSWVTSSSPHRSRAWTISAMNGARRLPAGPSSTAQIRRRAGRTSGPYTRSLGRLGRSILPWAAPARARRACRRVHPVRAHSSSRIRPFSALDPFAYRLSISFVTALRCAIERPTTPLLPQGRLARQERGASRTSQMRRRVVPRGHFR